MNRCWIILIAAICALASPGWAEGRKDLPARPENLPFPELSFTPPRPERVVMDNGMVVFLAPDKSIPQVRATALINAGALCEAAETQGLADLTARVMRLGGTHLVSATDMNSKLEYVGGSLECASQRDYTVVSLRVLSKDLDLGFGLMADLMRNPEFPPDKIDQRRGEALEELRRQDDDPMEITRREIRELLYGDHPYGRDPLGTPESLASFDRQDLVDFHSKWFHPDRTILAIAGDFDRDAMLKELDGLFAGWPQSGLEVDYPEPVSTGNEGKTFFIPKNLNQSTVRIGHLGIRKDNPDAIPLDVLNFIIGGGGFSSRLVNQVRTEKGFAYMVASIFDEPLLTGQYLAILQTQTKNTMAATELTLDIIRNAVETADLSEEEISLAKESKLNDFVFRFETPHDVVREYAVLEFYGLPLDYLETYRDRLAAVTLEDLKRVGQQYILPEKMTLVVLGSEEIRDQLRERGEFQEIELNAPVK